MSAQIELLETNGFEYEYGDVAPHHSHADHFQIIYIIQGSGTFTHNQDRILLNTNEFLLIAPGENHGFMPLKTPFCTVFDIKFSTPDATFCSQLKSLSGIHSVNNHSLQQLFDLAWNEAYERAPYHISIVRRLLEIIFLSIIRENTSSQSEDKHTRLPSHVIETHNNAAYSKLSACVQRTLKYIEGSVLENSSFNLENMANALGYNKTYMSRCFSNEIGISITQYRTLLKIDKAKELLQNTENDIASIGRYLSYNDVTSFTKIFKQYVGISPTEYRKLSPVSEDHCIRYSFRKLNNT